MDAADTLNVAQAAALLFADTETVLLLARQGQLPGAKIGKPWVFLRQDVLDFLRERIRKETEERRQLLQSTPQPVAQLMPVPRNGRRKPPPALPDLVLPAPPAPTKGAGPGRYRAG